MLRAAPASPQLTGTPLVSVWRAEHYRASPINWRVLQHPKTGFIYVSNNFGVLEFDGATWRLIPLPRGGPARALVVDAAGTVWVGGIGEFCALEPDAQGALHAVDRAPLIPRDPGAAAGATRETEDPDDDADRPDPHNVGTVNRGAAGPAGVYFRIRNRLVHFPADGAVRAWSLEDTLFHLWWSDDTLHLGQRGRRGVHRLEGTAVVPVAGGETIAAFASQWVTRPATSGGNSPAPAPPRRVLRLLSAQGPLESTDGQPARPLAAENAALFQNNAANCALFLADGRMAYGTGREGVILFDAQGRFERRLVYAHGLPSDHINGLAEDREGGLWIAMHFGIARVQLESPFAVHGRAQGLEGGPRDFTRHGDRLYVMHGEGLAWRSDADGRFHGVDGFRLGTYHAVPVGERLIVSATQLFELPPAGPPRVLRSSTYGALLAPPQPGDPLIASGVTSVWLWPRIAPDTERLKLESLPHGVNEFLPAGDGFVWAASKHGEVWRVDFRAGVRVDSPARRYLPGGEFAAARRRDGLHLVRVGDDVLASSEQWLLRHDAATDALVPETRLGFDGARQGPAAACSAPDGAAWFYLSGPNARLVRAAPRPDRTWTTDTFPAAALGDLAINAMHFDAPTRTLWIAGQGTLLSFTPGDRAARPAAPFRALIHHVAGAAGNVLATGYVRPAGAAPLALAPEQADLRFEFGATTFVPDYRGEVTTAYRTRLDGLDRDWTAWSGEARRDFTNLPPGRLVFRAQARDFAGRVSEEAALAFTLAPPWWRTPWAYLGYAACGVVAMAGVVKLRTRALRRKNEQLEGVIAARTTELRERNTELARLNQLELDGKISAQLAEEKAQLEVLRYQLNPHFLYNTLNSLYSLVALQPEAGPMVLRLSEFCRLTLTRGSEFQSVAAEFATLRAYLDIEQFRWGDKLAVTISATPAAAPQPLPPFLLLPLVENAIKHGLATSRKRLEVRLAARVDDAGRLEIEIANTGRWSESPAEGLVSTSIGLENLRRRLRRYYPDTHAFTIGQEGDWVVARLKLEQQKS